MRMEHLLNLRKCWEILKKANFCIYWISQQTWKEEKERERKKTRKLATNKPVEREKEQTSEVSMMNNG